MELWIPITVGAALMQCLRTALQRHLKGRLSTAGANYIRYVFGAPFALLALSILVLATGAELPSLHATFFVNALLGGLAQIVATSCLILAFTMRNFAVGTTYSKTETIQTAVLSTIFLAEPISLWAWGAVVVSLVGVLVLSLPARGGAWRDVLFGWTQKAALYGLAAGFLFGVSAITIRGASLSLGDGDPFLRSFTTLAAITALQTVMMTAYLLWFERDQFAAVIRHWRPSAMVGIMSVIGSAGWFTAMTLQNAALIRAVGQVELVFTVLVSRFAFREPPTLRELTGIALIAVAVVALLLYR